MQQAYEQRNQYFDFIRGIGCYLVFFAHVCILHLDFVMNSVFLHTLFNAIVYAIPIFIIISGKLMLRRAYSYREISKKIMQFYRFDCVLEFLICYSCLLATRDSYYLTNDIATDDKRCMAGELFLSILVFISLDVFIQYHPITISLIYHAQKTVITSSYVVGATVYLI